MINNLDYAAAKLHKASKSKAFAKVYEVDINGCEADGYIWGPLGSRKNR